MNPTIVATGATVHPTPRKHSLGFWIKRVLLAVLITLMALAATGATYELTMAAGDAQRYPPPGQLVDVGGYRLHFHCIGTGSPTVVLVAGLGGSSLHWSPVQPRIAPTTRVCVYDRAGLGWSDPDSRPRRAGGIADELHTLLKNGAVPGPYVLVGASAGGKYVRLYAERYASEVAGMVLVEARHESVDAAETAAEREAALAAARRTGTTYRWLGRLGIMRLFGARLAAVLSTGAAALPAETRTVMMVQASRERDIDAMLRESAAQMEDDEQLRAARPLGTLPLVVLAADSSIVTSPSWQTAQAIQAGLSTNSQLIIVPRSSHFLNLDQPEVVADAVHAVVEAARGGLLLAR